MYGNPRLGITLAKINFLYLERFRLFLPDHNVNKSVFPNIYTLFDRNTDFTLMEICRKIKMYSLPKSTTSKKALEINFSESTSFLWMEQERHQQKYMVSDFTSFYAPPSLPFNNQIKTKQDHRR